MPRAAVWTSARNRAHAASELSVPGRPELLAKQQPGWSKLIWFMMQPASETLRSGFEANGYATTMGAGPMELMRSGLLDSLGHGDVFVWVGVANLEWSFGVNNDTQMIVRSALHNLTAKGVLTVFYSTESFLAMTCAAKRQMPVREIWEYTRSNVLCCPDDPAFIRVRYVPPGYVPRSASGLPGSSLTGTSGSGGSGGSGSRMQRLPADSPPQLLFFGSNAPWYWMRRRCLAHVARRLADGWASSGHPPSVRAAAALSKGCLATGCAQCNSSLCPLVIKHTQSGDNKEWDRSVASHRYFLNVHKVCDWGLNDVEPAASSNASCESFRIAALLSSGAEVFSERCHRADEIEYGDLVRFLPMENLTDAVMAAWRAQATREAATRERVRRFAERFAPAAIFERAGLGAALAEHREKSRARRDRGWQWRPPPSWGLFLSMEGGTSSELSFHGVKPLRTVFPNVPAFCCLNEAECHVTNTLTSSRIRGNMTRYLELLHSPQRRKPARPAAEMVVRRGNG